MRKVYLKVVVNMVIEVEEGIEIGDVVSELEGFNSSMEEADVLVCDIERFEVTDSK